jgi:hypothetical protein
MFGVFVLSVFVACSSFFTFAQSPETLLVSRDVCDPEANAWKDKDWVTASGSWEGIDERATGAPAAGKTLRVTGSFPGKVFAYWGLEPVKSAGTIPGDPKRIVGYTRRSSDKVGVDVIFNDANGKERKFNVKFGDNEWQKFELTIPADMQRPITFGGFLLSNWFSRNDPEPSSVNFDFCDFRIETDVGAIPLNERPYSLGLSFPAIGNIFYEDEKPEVVISASSWLGENRKIDIKGKVISADGREEALAVPQLECLDSASISVPLPFAAPGAYTVKLDVSGFPEKKSFSSRYVVCLKPPALTMDQKIASPYAINIHGGTYVGYDRFARLGFVWIRDYAYTFDWMTNSRGVGDYTGWPWPRKMEAQAEANGLLTLPCLMDSVKFDEGKEGGMPEPDVNWRKDLAHFIASFGKFQAYELENEVNFRLSVESPVYAAYHKAFGQVVKAIRPDAWTVEAGVAGIYPHATRKHVLNGDFENIDVCNGHHYCGIAAPEYGMMNANTGQGEVAQMLQRDLFRDWKKASMADGKERQLWVTEWGWDTLAGQIVTEWEQAAYLQRGYMLGLANGVDKLFWYWYYDSDTDTPSNFFDGCGIFDRFRDPKPVASAFSALRYFLPTDMKYVGYALPGPNTMVQIFEIGGKYVAAAFKIRLEGADFTLDSQPKAEGVYDMFGAAVDGKGKRKMDVAPTWYIGLDPGSDWLKQAQMDVDSHHFVRSVAGEPIEIAVAETGDYSIKVPEDWSGERTDTGFSVQSPEGTPRGSAEIFVTGVNAGAHKLMKIDVDIVPEAYAKAYAVDFDGIFKVDIVNQSATRKSQKIVAQMPAGWKVEPMEQSLDLDPDEKGTLEFKLLASTPISAAEKEDIPRMAVEKESGLVIDHLPVVPREWSIKKVSKIKVDASLDDWDTAHQVPAWMLGPYGDKEQTRVYMGYADEGIYIALDVKDSKCFVSDPNSFWRAADCFEFMFMPEGNFTPGSKWTDNHHQFWFCPLAGEGRAFAGLWGRTDTQKIEADIRDIRTAVRKTGMEKDGGYVMEIFIPSSRIKGYKPVKGVKSAISFTLAVQGHRNNREVFWPAGKADNLIGSPWKWGRVTLD